MVWTVQMRIDTIKSYSNIIGLDVSAEELKLKGVKVTITSYRKHGGKAYEYTEFWIIPDGKLEDNSYLKQPAYPLSAPVSHQVLKTLPIKFFFKRRWR